MQLFLLRAIEKKLSPGHNYSDFAEDGEASNLWKDRTKCAVNFSDAFSDARTSIQDLEDKLTKQRQLQRPGPLEDGKFPIVECDRPRSVESPH